MPSLLIGASCVLLGAPGEPGGAAACSPEAGRQGGSPGQYWDGAAMKCHQRDYGAC